MRVRRPEVLYNTEYRFGDFHSEVGPVCESDDITNECYDLGGHMIVMFDRDPSTGKRVQL